MMDKHRKEAKDESLAAAPAMKRLAQPASSKGNGAVKAQRGKTRSGVSAEAWAQLFESLPEPDLSANSVTVLEARYLRRDEEGNVLETPKDMFFRVARTIAEPEAQYGQGPDEIVAWARRFYEVIARREFMPNSPTLMNAGREMGMLSACFVLPVVDSIDGIFDSVKATALIQKAGGGTGFAFDELRPTGDFIKSSGGTTSGPISFWKVFSEATNAIQQGAFRRGANMGMMYIDHPDILKFIYAKEDLTRFTNYNISVKVTDEFMDKLRAEPHQPHIVKNPRNGRKYVLGRDLDVHTYQIQDLAPVEDAAPEIDVDEKTGKVKSNVWTVGQVFDIIVDCAWRTGEPGVVFMDRIHETNPTPHVGRMEATNPCGEQPLLPYEACNLGSINLGRFIRNEDSPETSFDWDALRETIRVSTRFLDNVVDANNYPIQPIHDMCHANRKIGLGLMGFADTLFKLGIRYDSNEGVAFGESVMKFINDEAHNASEALAEERGCFPNWEGSTWDTRHQRKMRNACATTVAPTGTISIISGCSGGVEPMFSLAFFRNVLDGKKLIEVNRHFESVAKARGFHSKELMEQIAEHGTLAHVDGIPQDVRDTFVCAHDIAPEWHVHMQAAFQKHNDSSISKTTNFPHDATREQVRQIYNLAYEQRLKGVTVYRDGCRQNQPMALNNKKKKKDGDEASAQETSKGDQPVALGQVIRPVSTPVILSAVRIRQATPFGHMHLSISVDPRIDRELEVFAQLGKGGDLAASDLEAICRMVSLFLRSGGGLDQVVDQLAGIGSSLSVPSRDGRVMSLGDGIAKALQKYLRAKAAYSLKAILLGEVDFDNVPDNGDSQAPTATTRTTNSGAVQDRINSAFKVTCPECQVVPLVFEEGCVKCPGCGYSQC